MKNLLPYQTLSEYFKDLLAYVDFKLAEYHAATIDQSGNDTLGWVTKSQTPEMLKYQSLANETMNRIGERIHMTNGSALLLTLEHVCQTFNLTDLERFLLILSVSVELDPSFARSFVQFNEDAAYRYPTLGLALKVYAPDKDAYLKCRSALTTQSKIFKYFFAATALRHHDLPLISIPLSLDRSIVDFLVDFDHYELHHPFLKLYYPYSLHNDFAHQGTLDRLTAFVESRYETNHDDTLMLMIHGDHGVGKHDTVAAFCDYFNQSALIVNCRALSQSEITAGEINRITREAMLNRTVIVFDHFDVLIERLHEDAATYALDDLLAAVRRFARVCFALSEAPWNPERTFQAFTIIDIPMFPPSAVERFELWHAALSDHLVSESIDLHALANTFKFSPEQIKRSVTAVENLKLWAGANAIDGQMLRQACYLQTASELNTLALRLHSDYTLEDLVLPDEHRQQILEACNHVKYKHVVYQQWGFEKKVTYGTGLGMLFTGPPGTGKTLSAQVIANHLGLTLYRVDLSQVISKYIGETEKNLKKIFDEAEKSHAILLFDEGDALFSKRTDVGDAKDKYANVETSFLLQKIEAYPGIAIVTTNLLGNIDEAFIRRFAFVIHFPFPDQAQRIKIWHQIFPKETPLSPQIDFDFLAERFELSGGNIKNIALNASFLAAASNRPIQMQDIVRSVAAEIAKTGKAVLPSEFDPYAFMLS